jgi:predicted aspartyl protease
LEEAIKIQMSLDPIPTKRATSKIESNLLAMDLLPMVTLGLQTLHLLGKAINLMLGSNDITKVHSITANF